MGVAIGGVIVIMVVVVMAVVTVLVPLGLVCVQGGHGGKSWGAEGLLRQPMIAGDLLADLSGVLALVVSVTVEGEIGIHLADDGVVLGAHVKLGHGKLFR